MSFIFAGLGNFARVSPLGFLSQEFVAKLSGKICEVLNGRDIGVDRSKRPWNSLIQKYFGNTRFKTVHSSYFTTFEA